jgi:hypothetical protein
MPDGGFIIDKPDDIEAYFLRARYFALKLEIRTGMSHSQGSVMKFLKQKHGFKRGTKKGVLAEYKEYLAGRGIIVD